MSQENPYTSESSQLIDLQELQSWILKEDDHLLVINKPGWVVCHPSKNGPLSSLVGACREYTGLERLHLISRLDRETSGLVVFAKHRKMARTLQMAIESRNVTKTYTAILSGQLTEALSIDLPLAKDFNSPVHVKQTVSNDRTAQKAQTIFTPLQSNNNYTLAHVSPITGRKHQIRAHALHIGHPIVGDKLYGPDETLYLEFIENGWTERIDKLLPFQRQALHASTLEFQTDDYEETFHAPLLSDMEDFINLKVKA